MRSGGSLTIDGTSVQGGAVIAGKGASNFGGADGQALGTGIFLDDVTIGFGGNGISTIQDTIAGTGGISMDGTGTLILGGANTYTGLTTVNSGLLLLQGPLATIAGPVLVNQLGTLAGTGSIGPTTVNGTISPGAPGTAGTLTVNGSYTQNAGSTFKVVASPTGASQISVNGPATVRGGAVAFSSGGGAGILPGTKFPILQATGGLTGQFTSLSGDLTGVTFATLTYDANDAYLTFFGPKFEHIGDQEGCGEFGRILDDASRGASGDLADVLRLLFGLDDDSLKLALRQAGAIDETFTPRALVTSSFEFEQTIGRRCEDQHRRHRRHHKKSEGEDDNSRGGGIGGVSKLGASGAVSSMLTPPPVDTLKRDRDWEGWFEVFGSHGNAAGDIAFRDNGGAFGADRQVNDRLTLGFAVASYHTAVDALGGLTHTGIEDLHLALYGNWETEAKYVQAIAGHGNDEYGTTRVVPLGAAMRIASGAHNGDTTSGYVEAGLKRRWGALEARPLAALQYTGIHQGAYAESGAGALNLVFSSADTHSLSGSLGVRAIWDNEDGRHGEFVPELRARWVHEIDRGSGAVLASLPAAGAAAFMIAGPTPKRDAALLGVGVQCDQNRNAGLRFNYDAFLQSGQTVHSVEGSYQVRF